LWVRKPKKAVTHLRTGCCSEVVDRRLPSILQRCRRRRNERCAGRYGAHALVECLPAPSACALLRCGVLLRVRVRGKSAWNARTRAVHVCTVHGVSQILKMQNFLFLHFFKIVLGPACTLHYVAPATPAPAEPYVHTPCSSLYWPSDVIYPARAWVRVPPACEVI
jgi:hypothetical protein